MSNLTFMILGKTEPIYELSITSGPSYVGADAGQYLQQFILHSSLDILISQIVTNSAIFLKVIDRFNSLLVSAYVTPGGTVMLLLHNGKVRCANKLLFIILERNSRHNDDEEY